MICLRIAEALRQNLPITLENEEASGTFWGFFVAVINASVSLLGVSHGAGSNEAFGGRNRQRKERKVLVGPR